MFIQWTQAGFNFLRDLQAKDKKDCFNRVENYLSPFSATLCDLAGARNN